MTPVTLREFRGEAIKISCARCNKHATFDRKALVKKFGAKMKFVQLSRVLSIGCERHGTGQCEASFPGLMK